MMLLLSTLLLGAPALADDGAATAVEAEPDLPPPGPVPAAHQVDEITHRVAKRLRCPVCQGLSVADSPSETAVTMKKRVRELVSQGYSEGQIQDYFVERYGEWVLLDPPGGGLNALLWAVPLGGLVLVVGLGAAFARRRPDGVVTVVDTGPRDDFESRLLAEADE
jgi:cytochrome c-type biogenesis protein CcmH